MTPPHAIVAPQTRGSRVDFAVLGQFVNAQLAYLGLTASQGADQAGVDASKFSLVRQGKPVALDNLCRFADWLQLPLDAFRVPPEGDAQASARFRRRVERYCSTEDMERRLGALDAVVRLVDR